MTYYNLTKLAFRKEDLKSSDEYKNEAIGLASLAGLSELGKNVALQSASRHQKDLNVPVSNMFDAMKQKSDLESVGKALGKHREEIEAIKNSPHNALDSLKNSGIDLEQPHIKKLLEDYAQEKPNAIKRVQDQMQSLAKNHGLNSADDLPDRLSELQKKILQHTDEQIPISKRVSNRLAASRYLGYGTLALGMAAGGRAGLGIYAKNQENKQKQSKQSGK